MATLAWDRLFLVAMLITFAASPRGEGLAQVSAFEDSIPPGAHFVASTRGTVFYWISESCGAWQDLEAENRLWFRSRAEALLAGYRPSQTPGCDAPPEWRPTEAPPVLQEAPARGLGPPGRDCTVKRILDGDTVDCEDGRRVRLLLMDAPEMDQEPFGAIARNALINLAPVGTVLKTESDIQSQDRYGRYLAHLFTIDGISIGESLLRQGMGLVSVFPPNVNYVERFRRAAQEARIQNRGLWAISGFVCSPADHRAGKCDASLDQPSAHLSR